MSIEIKDYHIEIEVMAEPAKVMEAIEKVSEWWGKDFTGQSKNVGDIFTIRFNETYSTFRITEKLENKKLVWAVLDSHLHWLKDKTEWNHTHVEWTLEKMEETTRVQMIHFGLGPEVECFDNCTKGWNYYIGESLNKLINEGKGMPDTPQTIRIRESL